MSKGNANEKALILLDKRLTQIIKEKKEEAKKEIARQEALKEEVVIPNVGTP